MSDSAGTSPDATLISGRGSAAAAQTPSMAELGRTMEGRSLGPYRLLEFIGGGGMGAVFRALDSTLDRIVAVKVLSRQQSSDDEMLKRFRNEAQSAARLDHENIGRVYAVGSDEGWHYIVFEYIEGTNLRDVIVRGGPFDLGRTIDVTVQLADALEHASQREVVHRDIKPSNIIITPAGRARIVDMGLARLHQVAGDNDLTSSGMTLGTFDYISPEQARDPREADVRSDLYSLGCTIYFMLAGRPPFADGTMVQKLLQHQQDDPPAIETIRPDVPRRFGEILRRLMRKNPDDRHQRPAELVADLLAFADEAGIELASPRPAVVPTPRPVPQQRRLIDHVAWVLPVAVLGLVVGGLWLRGTRHRQDAARVMAAAVSPSSSEAEQAAVWRVVEDPSAANERASLAEALHVAADGDMIELAYSGIRDEPPLVIESKQVSIRAADGFRPGVRFAESLPIPLAADGRGMVSMPRQASCLVDAAALRIEGVFVQTTGGPRVDGGATSVFAVRGACRLECVDTRLQLLRAFELAQADSFSAVPPGEDAFVECLETTSAGEPSAIRIVRSTVEGDANFLEIAGAASIDVVWSESSLVQARRFVVAAGGEPSAPRGPQVRLALDNSSFDCQAGFASLRDSPSAPILPTLRGFAESSRFHTGKGRPFLEQSGVGDPDDYQAAVAWLDAGGRYVGSPIFRRIDGAAERIEIDYAAAGQPLAHATDDSDWNDDVR